MGIAYAEHSFPVERFQRGDPEAFSEIVGRYQNYVYGLACHFTQDCEDAYDISQEVFIKVFKSLGKLKDTSSFDAWLKRVTVNACIDYIRRRPKEQAWDNFLNEAQESVTYRNIEMPDGDVESGELVRVISRAVNRLPKAQRNVFMLRHYEGLSLREIAESLDCSTGTVKAHLFRATRRMRKMLSPYVSQPV